MSVAVLADRERYVPPSPEPARGSPSSWDLLKLYRGNALRAWPAHAYEDDVVVQAMFGRTTLIVNAPDGIRRVLVENVSNYDRTRPTIRIIRPLLGDGLFLAEGDSWRRQRRTIAPAFAPRAQPLFAGATAQALQAALPRLVQAAGTAQRVDLLSWFQALALDVAGRAMFSLPMAPYAAAMRRLMTEYGLRYGRMSFFDIFLPLWLPNLQDLGRRAFQRRWLRLIDRLIADRRRLPRGATPADLFELLQTAERPDGGPVFTPAAIRDQVATLIVAGHETTAVALFWACFLLAGAPAWQERIAAEAAGLDLSPAGAPAALARLPATRAVFEEALRLYPPAYVIVRHARGPDRVAGHAIARDAAVMVSPWVLHRHRRLWAEPDAFDPARFLPGAPPVDRYAYLPFGVGPRVCVGASLAMTEATLALATLVRQFRIGRADTLPVLPVAVVTTQPNRPVTFILSSRD
jgi:cytochrome P450